MTMRPATDISNGYKKKDKELEESTGIHRILLSPGDVLALSKDARYKWEHGIKEQLYDTIDDRIIVRGTRISVTLRKLKSGATLNDMATFSKTR